MRKERRDRDDTTSPHCRLLRQARLGQRKHVKFGDNLLFSDGTFYYLKVTGRFSPIGEELVRLKIAFQPIIYQVLKTVTGIFPSLMSSN